MSSSAEFYLVVNIILLPSWDDRNPFPLFFTVRTLEKKRRPLNVKETKTLQKIRSTAQKDLAQGLKLHYIAVAVIIGALCLYVANWTRYDVVALIFGTIAVFGFSCLAFMPYELFKFRRKAKQKIKQVEGLLAENSIEVYSVIATRIAVAKEFEDEGDLYIIETAGNDILYLWDYDYNLKKNFPCLEFEIYSDEFFKVIGRQIYPLTEKIKPFVITAKAKWAYMKKIGPPGHLALEKKSFDKVVERINKFAP